MLCLLISQSVQSALPSVSEISVFPTVVSSAENPTLSTYKYTEQISDQVDIVLVDQALQDQALLKQAAKNTDHYILFNSATDSAADIITYITDWATQTQQTINSISIISHGSEGSFQFGYERITAENINANIKLWQELAGLLTNNANIYIYGCEVGKGPAGKLLLNSLASTTNANIYASTNITGNNSDWELEASSSNVKTALRKNTATPLNKKLLANYAGILADTGYRYPTGNSTDWSNPTGALTDNNDWVNTTGNNYQEYSNFGFAIPAGSIIKGIQWQYQDKANGSIVGTGSMGYELSDDGATWRSSGSTTGFVCLLGICGGHEGTFGGSADLWGKGDWVASDFDDGNFRVRIQRFGVGVGGIRMHVDYLRVKVHYSPPSENHSTISVSPSSLTANGVATSTVTVQVKDDTGTDITTGGLAVTISQGGGSATLSGVTDENDGTYTATLSSTVAEIITITSTISTNTITTGDPTITFNPGAAVAANSTMSVSSSTVLADGSSTSTITVQAKDAFNNNLTSDTGITVALSELTDATIGVVSYAGSGTYAATITNSTVEVVTISAEIDSTSISNTSNVSFVPGAASTAQSTISVSPSSVTANGSSTSTITVQTKDSSGHDLTADTVTIALSQDGSASIGVVSYSGAGAYTATVTNNTVESITVSGTIDTFPITDTAGINFTVINSAPVLSSAPSPALTGINEDDTSSAGTSVSIIVVNGSITDVDTPVEAIAITATDISNGIWQFKIGAGIWTNITGATNTNALLLNSADLIRFVPAGNYNGSANITFRAWDTTSSSEGNYVNTSANGGITAFSTVTDTASIAVSAINDTPVANADSDSVNEGAAVTIDLRSNDTDVETATGSMTVTNVSVATNGSIVNNNDGTVTYTHDGGETVGDTFTYTINDGTADSVAATVTVTINALNDTPIANADSDSVNEGAAVIFDLRGNDTDAETATGSMTVTNVSVATNGSIVNNNDGT
ncbi:MAG: hypothetical protein COA99_05325, partial [Moraxellaceae bacterium]